MSELGWEKINIKGIDNISIKDSCVGYDSVIVYGNRKDDKDDACMVVSNDGINWRPSQLKCRSIEKVLFNGSVYLAVYIKSDSNYYIATSINGIVWDNEQKTADIIGSNHRWIFEVNGKFILGCNGSINEYYMSVDNGITWTTMNLKSNYGITYICDIKYHKPMNLYVMICNIGGSVYIHYTNDDSLRSWNSYTSYKDNTGLYKIFIINNTLMIPYQTNYVYYVYCNISWNSVNIAFNINTYNRQINGMIFCNNMSYEYYTGFNNSYTYTFDKKMKDGSGSFNGTMLAYFKGVYIAHYNGVLYVYNVYPNRKMLPSPTFSSNSSLADNITTIHEMTSNLLKSIDDIQQTYSSKDVENLDSKLNSITQKFSEVIKGISSNVQELSMSFVKFRRETNANIQQLALNIQTIYKVISRK